MAGVGRRIFEALRANLNDWLDRARESSQSRESRADDALRDEHGDPYASDAKRKKVAQAYANLELEPGADLAAVKSQYRKLMGRYHPDRHHRDPAKAEIANRLAAELTRAYDTIVAHLESKTKR